MTVSLIVVTLLALGFGAWLVRQSLHVRPWVAEGASSAPALQVPAGVTAQRVGLAVFLAVVTSIFALTLSAYMMRMAVAPQWELLPNAPLAWFNTAVLLLASAALHWAWNAARRGQRAALSGALAAAAACTVAFIAMQYLLWAQLREAGFFLSTHPAAAFFALMSGLHALHLAGGLFVLAPALRRAAGGATPERLRETVALCALYWHYLLLVWLVLFLALFVGALPLYELCRSF